MPTDLSNNDVLARCKVHHPTIFFLTWCIGKWMDGFLFFPSYFDPSYWCSCHGSPLLFWFNFSPFFNFFFVSLVDQALLKEYIGIPCAGVARGEAKSNETHKKNTLRKFRKNIDCSGEENEPSE